MKKPVRLLLKLFVLLIIVVILNRLVSSLLPPTWGEPIINMKRELFEEQPEKHNTLFIGSSRFYRQISPQLFDSYFVGNQSLTSFNMGATSYFFPKTELLYRYLLQEDDRLEVVVFELSLNNEPAESNLHTREQIYWYSLKDTLFFVQSVWETQESMRVRGRLISRHLLSYAENLLNAGLGDDILAFYFEDGPSLRFLGPRGDGFYSLDEQALMNEPHILARRDDNSLQNTANRLNAAINAFRSIEEQKGNFNSVQLERLLKLIELSENNGIAFFVVLPPRLDRGSLEDFLPVLYALPEENIINLADPNLFPELYAHENSFDPAHLNAAGAEIFTRYLAERIKVVLSENELK